ncbi:hypothetical protein PHLGIDRAFT_130468 [Phlebiopsis gigantea 11061_1 CR5-6]|uniref:Barwin domain-containing protein n=1 Tax=Phlebiopsis gigantea (strain 11061_1 CR5-6) TaxID=745531 RepID=A0A0C3RRU3_PHLG1|nr:hypothetical protein PHLGIDRAFT_130468 [Phlebiopsis gigantea 11061_1 CR5-6]
MARFVTLFFALAAVLSATSGAPTPVEDIEKRAKTYHGRGTWYNTGLGACGWNNVDSDKVIALSSSIYGGGKHCGKTLTVTNKKNGKKATGKIVDECPGCASGDLDMTPGLFKKLGTLDEGVLSISWSL